MCIRTVNDITVYKNNYCDELQGDSYINVLFVAFVSLAYELLIL